MSDLTPSDKVHTLSKMLVEARSPLNEDMHLKTNGLPSQLEALCTLSRHAAGGLNVNEQTDSRVEDVARDAFRAALATHSSSKQSVFSSTLRSALPEPVAVTPQLQQVLDDVSYLRGAVSDLSVHISVGFDAQQEAIQASQASIRADLETQQDATSLQLQRSLQQSIASLSAQLNAFQSEVTASVAAFASTALQRSAATEAAVRALQELMESREVAATASFAAMQAASAARLDRLEAAVSAALGASSSATAAQVSLVI